MAELQAPQAISMLHPVRMRGGLMADDTKRANYGAAEVCLAAGVPRATFHSWVARKYITQAPGPGMGVAREYTLMEAIRIAAVAELNRLGVPVSLAAGYCAHISSDYADVRTIIVLGPPRKGGRGARKSLIPTMNIVSFDQTRDLDKWLGQMRCLTILDLTRVAADTKRTLNDPMAGHRANVRGESAWQRDTGEKLIIALPDPRSKSGVEPAPVRVRRSRAPKRREKVRA